MGKIVIFSVSYQMRLYLDAIHCLPQAYVQILLRDALRQPWLLNENVPVFNTLSGIYTGSFYLFDLALFGMNQELKANLFLRF